MSKLKRVIEFFDGPPILLIVFPLLILSVVVFVPWTMQLGAQTTGVCIFKGPAITGLFLNSDGIPLRGIGVTAWHKGGFGGEIIDGAGPTDRLGCFTISTVGSEFFSYSYNGTTYIDNVPQGVIVRDNLP